MKKYSILAAALMILFTASSCVSTKKYNSLNAEAMRLDSERIRGINTIASLRDDLDESRQNFDVLSAEHEKLKNDYKTFLETNSEEASRMLIELQNSQEELNKSREMLAEREKHVAELEQMLRNREAALEEIRRKVTDALLGFEGKGLTVTQRGSHVYVSMEDKLLFKSGSFNIDTQGAAAVKELSVVLAQNPDINIMVEGHTDNVPYRGSGQLQDNLDLSVKRATTVTRLILQNNDIDPSRITSAGRGEYLPLEDGDSAEVRQRNRRTEIILTPKLDELMELME
ncbi:MAG: OmpA family protein [Rikenellaceae bacterium]|nr:OmpA family protein [Rikenellaceae bacterium]